MNIKTGYIINEHGTPFMLNPADAIYDKASAYLKAMALAQNGKTVDLYELSILDDKYIIGIKVYVIDGSTMM